jgi:hypothetical protein
MCLLRIKHTLSILDAVYPEDTVQYINSNNDCCFLDLQTKATAAPPYCCPYQHLGSRYNFTVQISLLNKLKIMYSVITLTYDHAPISYEVKNVF